MSQIVKKFIANDAVDETKIELTNDQWLQAVAGNLLRWNTAQSAIEFVGIPRVGADTLATQAYADGIAAGLDLKEGVKVATTGPLPAVTAAGSGVGKTLTADVAGIVTIDGEQITAANGFATGERILVKNQSAPVDNGIYTITTLSDTGVALVLTRASDADGTPAGEVTSGMFCFVDIGTENNKTGWALGSFGGTVDTDAQNFTQFQGLPQYVWGAGLANPSGNTITADLLASGGLKFVGVGDAGEIAVEPADFAGTGLEDDGSDNLQLAVQGNGIAGGAGTVLSVDPATEVAGSRAAVYVGADGVGIDVDNVTLTHSSSILAVKAGGIGETELNNVDGGVDAGSFVLFTGYTAGAGTVAAGDTIQEAIQKIDAAASAASGANDTLSNLASPTAINQDLIGNKASFTVKTGNDATADANPTENLIIASGDKTAGTGDSGSVTVQSGSSTGGSRGPINLDGFASASLESSDGVQYGSYFGVSAVPALVIDGKTTEATSAGYVGLFFDADNATSEAIIGTKDQSAGSTASGRLYVKTGDHAATGNSGSMIMATGNADGASGNTGNYDIFTGDSNAAQSGFLNIGTGGAGTVVGGISISAGSGASGGNISVSSGGGATSTGNIIMNIPDSAGTQGEFKFLKSGAGNVPSVDQVWISNGTDGTGYWGDLAGTKVFADNVFYIYEQADPTKQFAFDLDAANFTAGSTATMVIEYGGTGTPIELRTATDAVEGLVLRSGSGTAGNASANTTVKTGNQGGLGGALVGSLTLSTGDKSNPGNTSANGTGDVFMFSGADAGTGAGVTGDVQISTGAKSNASSTGNTGAISLITGNAAGTASGDSGDIILQTGTVAAGGAFRGTITLNAAVDGALLAAQPTGGTALAIATTQYVDNAVAAKDDASEITYAPLTLADWNGGVDPGDVDDALDQLAARVTTLATGANTPVKQTFVLAAGDITNGYVDLAAVAKTDSIHFMVQGAGVLLEDDGASYDYTVSYTGGAGGFTRITWAVGLGLIAGDVVQIAYLS